MASLSLKKIYRPFQKSVSENPRKYILSICFYIRNPQLFVFHIFVIILFARGRAKCSGTNILKMIYRHFRFLFSTCFKSNWFSLSYAWPWFSPISERIFKLFLQDISRDAIATNRENKENKNLTYILARARVGGQK